MTTPSRKLSSKKRKLLDAVDTANLLLHTASVNVPNGKLAKFASIVNALDAFIMDTFPARDDVHSEVHDTRMRIRAVRDGVVDKVNIVSKKRLTSLSKR